MQEELLMGGGGGGQIFYSKSRLQILSKTFDYFLLTFKVAGILVVLLFFEIVVGPLPTDSQ